MISRRSFVVATCGVLVAGCSSGSSGTTDTDTDEGPAGTTASTGDGTATTETGRTDPLTVSTSAFDDGESIPERYTGAGEDVSPPLTVESVPADAETLAVVVDDPDANDYLHWLIWNIPADRTEIPEGIPRTATVDSLDGARQGTNDFGGLGYRGPLPPTDDGPHTYRFTTVAVDTTLDVESGAGRDALESALDGRIVNRHRFTGEFEQ
ncbi:YbhB/YbcL family Raf kinase inhibitor-like protein [Halobacteriales archaeon QH_8_67_27]|nr:MAG: YbhB/YbcL family Raf kinase inhibitor-like protein [Halobacteriales archaeon QH_8_67_27]